MVLAIKSHEHWRDYIEAAMGPNMYLDISHRSIEIHVPERSAIVNRISNS